MQPASQFTKPIYPSIRNFRFRNREIKEYIKICKAVRNQKKLLANIKSKKAVKTVLFFVIDDSIWKLENLYKLMEQDLRFNPIIVVCPYVLMGKEVMIRRLNKTFDHFSGKGYHVVKGIEDGQFLDFKKQFEPTLIIYTNPHKLTDRLFLPEKNIDILSVYIPYAHQISQYDNYKAQYNQISHNLMWQIFTTNELDKEIFKHFSKRRATNVIVTGYPGIEGLLIKNPEQKSVWKNIEKLKIIFAPHHTVEKDSPLSYSTFLRYGDFIKDLAIKYQDQVNFAFKPHPLLKDKLKDIWGNDRTESYYNFWKNASNTQLESSNYIDLFNQSDAIIHDSGSFLAEYLYVNKPCMYLTSEKGIDETKYNPFGLLCMENYEKGINETQIESFIQRVIANEDLNKHKRNAFVGNFCQFEELPSDIIFNYLSSQLFVSND